MENNFFRRGNEDTDTLVVYFSSKGRQANGNLKKGNTAVFAEEIARQTGADLFELVSIDNHYPDNLLPLQGIAKRDMKESARPAYRGEVPDFGKYKRVFIGGPAWYLEWPMINYTFLEKHDFSVKEIVPFGTHVATPGVPSVAERLKLSWPQASILPGMSLKGPAAQKMAEETVKEIEAWITKL